MKPLLAALLLAAAPAGAQQIIASYGAWIGEEDQVNSRGVALGEIGAAVQQDRANYHRFGIRHVPDEWDGIFSDRATRALIPDLIQRGGTHGSFDGFVDGLPFGIWVSVCGRGGVPRYINLGRDEQGPHGCP